MSDAPQTHEHHEPPRPTFFQRVKDRRYLWISILVHGLFILAATAWVVQTMVAERKLNFSAPPPSTNPGRKATEHKVQMAKKQNTMSAPAQAKRIASTGASKVSLPDMPTMAASSDIIPGQMSGMGGTGMGLGGFGGTGGGLGGGGGGPVPLFGLRTGAGLAGNFYDLKQTKDGKPSPMAVGPNEPDGWRGKDLEVNKTYDKVLFRALSSDSVLREYFRAPQTLYATQFYIPIISADEAPKSFNVADKATPRRWVVKYQGKVRAPESGRYRFVGYADDLLVVRFNNTLALDASMFRPTEKGEMQWDDRAKKPIQGKTFDVQAGMPYPIEIFMGERPGGEFRCYLLIEKVDENAATFPIFKLAPSPMPTDHRDLPDVAPDTTWSVWKADPSRPIF